VFWELAAIFAIVVVFVALVMFLMVVAARLAKRRWDSHGHANEGHRSGADGRRAA